MLTLPPLSLYVHIPWCIRKCPYCDFNSHAASHAESAGLPEDDYINALVADLQRERGKAQGRELCSVFFGGGTPSLFSATGIGRILKAADQLIGFADRAEITLEANPGTAEQARFRGYREVGVNRLSIGIQSFSTVMLQALGRIHCDTEARNAIAVAQQAGFDNINLDLMHGLPGQTASMALADLEQATAMAPAHISWYQLTIEPNTAFYSGTPVLPNETVLAEIQEQGQQLLAASGYGQYEVSAFSREQRESAHNLNYWQFGDYLGIGAGAHGKVTEPDTGQIIRNQKIRQPNGYMSGADRGFTARESAIGREELTLEFFMNALRLRRGVPREMFALRTGLAEHSITATWENLAKDGLVEPWGQTLTTTPNGFAFLNEVLLRLDQYLE